jgi:hypothetical protein
LKHFNHCLKDVAVELLHPYFAIACLAFLLSYSH